MLPVRICLEYSPWSSLSGTVGLVKLISVIVSTELLAVPDEMLIISEELVRALTSRVKFPLPERLATVRVSYAESLRFRVWLLALRVPPKEILEVIFCCSFNLTVPVPKMPLAN